MYLVEPSHEAAVGIHQCETNSAWALRNDCKEHPVGQDIVGAKPHAAHEEATVECDQQKIAVVKLQRNAQVAADSLFHKVEHARDFHARDVTHGNAQGQSAEGNAHFSE